MTELVKKKHELYFVVGNPIITFAPYWNNSSMHQLMSKKILERSLGLLFLTNTF